MQLIKSCSKCRTNISLYIRVNSRIRPLSTCETISRWKLISRLTRKWKHDLRPFHRPREQRNSSSWRRSSSVSRGCWNRAVPAIVAATAWNPRNRNGKLISRCRRVQTSLRMHPRRKRTRIICRLKMSRRFPARLHPRTNMFSKRWVRHTSDGDLSLDTDYISYRWSQKKHDHFRSRQSRAVCAARVQFQDYA